MGGSDVAQDDDVQAAAEARFLAGSGHDAVIARDATRAFLAALDFETLSHLVSVTNRSLAKEGGVRLFVDAMVEFRGIARERLASGMDGARATDERASKMQAKIKTAESELAQKQRLLLERRESRQLEAATISDQITKLRAEIDDVTGKGKANEAALSAFSSQQEASQKGTHASKIAELRDELSRLTADCSKLVDANEAASSTLRKRRNHVRSEYARVIAEYDRDLLEVTEKISVSALAPCEITSLLREVLLSIARVQKIRELIAREKAQLDILRPHFALVDMNNRAAAEEAEIVRKRKEAETAAREATYGPPVRKIQRWFKRIMHRRAADKKKKGKGKAKGKKK